MLFRSLVQVHLIPIRQHVCETEFLGNSDTAHRVPSDFYAEDYDRTPPGPLPLVAASASTLGALPAWGKRLQVSGDAWEDDDGKSDDRPFWWEFPDSHESISVMY